VNEYYLRMPSTYVALLRGVNVGGNNKLPMKDLASIFQKCGCNNVRTYIQSGNVVFECPTSVARLQETVGSAIEKKFGFNPSLVLRKLGDLEQVVKNNPFLKAGAAETELHVVFLGDAPKAEEVVKLETNRVPPDEFAVLGKEIYLRLPNGAGRSKLASVKLKTLATARNWRTVNKLIEMMKD
jgi:uncharacterized protein (DUF1697 family)